MKKVLISVVAVLLVLMLCIVCACSYVPSTSFLSRSRVKSLVKTYGTPQAQVTITYKRGTDAREIKITYDLLLSQTPLAVIRFIQLANEEFYDDTIVDTFNSTNNYAVMGRYAAYPESEDSTTYKYYDKQLDRTFKGEFKSNDYKEPDGGYAQFANLSLAMFHENEGKYFDSANGTLIMALANADNTLNSNNYAVFATMRSLTLKINDEVIGKEDRTTVPGTILDDFKALSSKSTTIYKDQTEENGSFTKSILREVFIKVEILDTNGRVNDWSKLPQIGR